MKRKRVRLSEFIVLVSKNKKIDCEIVLDKLECERKLLENFCSLNLDINKYQEAWSIILDAVAEKFYPNDMTEFFTSSTLEFLIQNNICLNDLGHLQLQDEWLKKIYDKDNNCIEAKQTIEKRRTINKME